MITEKANFFNSKNKYVQSLGFVFVFYVVATFLKAPSIFLKPRFWAEEGVVYFLQGRSISFADTWTAMPLGYLSFPANIAGWIAAQIPLYYAPVGSFFVSFAIQLLIPCVLIFNRYFDDNRIKQAFFLMVPLLVFQSFETWLNSINSQFWMILAIALVLAAPKIKHRWPTVVFNVLVALLAGLSTPGSAFLAPLFFLRTVMEREVKWAMYGATASVGAILVLALQQGSRGVSFPVDVWGVFASFHLVLNNICMPCSRAIFSSLAQYETLRWVLAFLIGLIYAVFWVRAEKMGRWLLTASAVVALLSFASMLGKEMVLDNSPFFNARYFFAPTALFFGALLLRAFQGSLLEIVILTVFVLNGVASSIYYPPVGAPYGKAWRQSVKEFDRKESDVIYFARDWCAFSPTANQSTPKMAIEKLTADTLEISTSSSLPEDTQFFFYKQSFKNFRWEVAAPEWRQTSMFLAGTEQFGQCYGGDLAVHDKNVQLRDGKISINASLLGPLEGYRFLVGYGKDFSAMLAKRDYLMIDGAQLQSVRK